jgi:hypothetical protein
VTRPVETCASCSHFPRAALETGEPVRCEHRELTVAWNSRACVLHGHVSMGERDARRRLVAVLIERAGGV